MPPSEQPGVRAAAMVQKAAQVAQDERGQFTLAVSGGRTPLRMFQAIAAADIDWKRVHLFQVDERLAPDGHVDRNFLMVQQQLLDHVDIPADHVHPMPVALAQTDAEAAAQQYAQLLRAVCGPKGVLDLVHLGLGDDGHTASLMPDDPLLQVVDRDVGVTDLVYGGWRRMTLTLPAINRARQILWLVSGVDKATMVDRLMASDDTIPAGRVASGHATLITER